LATRRHVAAAEPVGQAVAAQATATSRSAVSRRFIAATKTALAELLARDLAPLDVKVLMVDGEHLAEHLFHEVSMGALIKTAMTLGAVVARGHGSSPSDNNAFQRASAVFDTLQADCVTCSRQSSGEHATDLARSPVWQQ
jgi:hypothetical protein